tara:strand:- start:149 stop:1186 length:1038 start_codon:yes stop_codon:yes gene_type:complete
MTGNLLMFARDPGSANQLIALRELICGRLAGLETEELFLDATELVATLAKGRKVNEILFGGLDAALYVLKEAGIETEQDIARSVLQTPTQMLRENGISIVVTGLSDRDDQTPQELWRAARSSNVHSIALADDSTLSLPHARQDFKERFRDSRGLLVFPDVLCVVDEQSREAIIAAGMSRDATRVIGNLHLRRFQQLAKTVEQKKLTWLREIWGGNKKSQILLYVSEPITQMREYGKKRNHDELSLLEELLSQIQKGELSNGVPCNTNTMVVVRPHPRDDEKKFEPYLSDHRPRVIVSRHGSSAEAALAADIIVGITSMLLVEAATLKRPTLSLIGFNPQAAAIMS